MNVDLGLAQTSNNLLVAAVLLYSLAMIGYAAEFAFAGRVGRAPRRRPVAHAATSLQELSRAALVVPEVPAYLRKGESGQPLPGRRSERIGRAAVVLTALGWAAHASSVATRGFAAHRVPWGNMYEFSCAITLAGVTAYLVVLSRQQVRYLGAFVMLPVVVTLGIAGTLLYAKAEPLQPALQSYWLKIHVAAAIIAWGTFLVGAVVTALYLVKERFERLPVAAGRGGIMRRLPAAEQLDALSYKVIAFAFPIWTFAIVAGAVWAEAAWGRYWGWDPKETWSFITWVIYAGYLHARATAGWSGRKAAIVAMAGFTALTVDYYVVNIVVSGLHSYAGL